MLEVVTQTYTDTHNAKKRKEQTIADGKLYHQIYILLPLRRPPKILDSYLCPEVRHDRAGEMRQTQKLTPNHEHLSLSRRVNRLY